jgi:hypothetical protein
MELSIEFGAQLGIKSSTAARYVRFAEGHCQSKFYTACPRTRAGWSSTVFARESPTRSAGFDAENRLYLFALTVPQRGPRHHHVEVSGAEI